MPHGAMKPGCPEAEVGGGNTSSYRVVSGRTLRTTENRSTCYIEVETALGFPNSASAIPTRSCALAAQTSGQVVTCLNHSGSLFPGSRPRCP